MCAKNRGMAPPFVLCSLALTPAPRYCMIGYPSRAYLWIMSRTPKMDPKLYNELIDKAKNKHQYDLTGLRVVPQDWKDRAMAKKRDVEMETADPTMQ
jgi:lipocalin